jgi:hypothetical protein
VWLWCERCQHHTPFACAVAVIRRGPNVSSDKLRAAARCTSCDSKGATIQHPGRAGNHIGFSPFPKNVGDEAPPSTKHRGLPLMSDPASLATLDVLTISPADFLDRIFPRRF